MQQRQTFAQNRIPVRSGLNHLRLDFTRQSHLRAAILVECQQCARADLRFQPVKKP